jgi:thioesterase domain-containing protein
MTWRLDALQRVLAAQLPITQHLGLRVGAADEDGVTLRLPLAPNRNHKGTLFAGSLNSAVTLAGWSTLWLLLDREGLVADIVIQDSGTEYLSPVAGDCEAIGAWPVPSVARRFFDTLRRRGRARITLEARVLAGDVPAVRFRGRYVAHCRADEGLRVGAGPGSPY